MKKTALSFKLQYVNITDENLENVKRKNMQLDKNPFSIYDLSKIQYQENNKSITF